jgi:alanine dehydrogenase
MIVGVTRETKSDESRVSLLPVGAQVLVEKGHAVLIEKGAGLASGFDDAAYADVGATLVDGPQRVFGEADLVVKVKEPQAFEIAMFRPGQTIFTYFHFAASDELAAGCIESEIVAVAYETVHDRHGRLPLLTPMSEIAGKMSVQEGAKYLERPNGGRGVLLGGVPGVPPANVVVLGAGVVGTAAAKIAAGFGANVRLFDVDLDRLRYLSDVLPANVMTVFSDKHTLAHYVHRADLIIGAVLIPGARAPRLVTRDMLDGMLDGAVVVDVAVDQGGCIETSRPTTHADPTFVVNGVLHYCVANMPGAVPATSATALCNATFPYVLKLAQLGLDKAVEGDPGLAQGVNMVRGRVTNPAVASALNHPYSPLRPGVAA